MKKQSKKGIIFILSLVAILAFVLIAGIYRDKIATENNKKENEVIKLNQEQKVKENTKYYIQKTLDKLNNGEDTLILFAGDSVTDGLNASDKVNKSYTGLFANWIAEKYPDSTVKLAKGNNIEYFKPIRNFDERIIQTGNKNTITIVNAGVSSDSMFQFFNRSNNFIGYNGKAPDCIFIMEGINDAFDTVKYRYSTPERFQQLQGAFIDYLEDETNADIVMMTSHWEGNNLDSSINFYVDAQRKIAKDKNLLLIDNRDVWNKHYDSTAPNHGQGDWLTQDDSIHPTDKGHEVIFKNIIDNLYKTTLKNTTINNLIKMDNDQINYEGSWEDVNITDKNANASYYYKRGNSQDSKINAKLKGNQIYAIVRDGKDSVKFDNTSDKYETNQIGIGGSEYSQEFITVNNQDMYSAHHRRILLYDGKNQECNITLDNIKGNLDLYGFETIVDNK
jgi:lysophospholipase L1-like esterase